MGIRHGINVSPETKVKAVDPLDSDSWGPENNGIFEQ